MATVYLAEDLKHDRKVALKVLKPELAAVLGAERFVVEIKTTASLSHPHILPLFDSGTADGFLFYVMPYVEGETLRDKLNRETQLSIDEAVKDATEIADALHYAHQHGVIHRDIKPENILLQNGRPMVADFGIALAVSAAAGGRMTETGLRLGTPHYMSPEQATAEKEITARSDVYSLGSVLYEMLTGSPPHTGSSAQQIIMKIITEEAQLVTALRKSVPANVAAAVAKSLEKLPADRFESAAKFSDALTNPGFAMAAFLATTSTGVGTYHGNRRQTLALGAFAIVATVVASWGWLRPAPPGEVLRYSVALPTDQTLGETQGSRLALSPDGRVLVYVASLPAGRQLIVRKRDELDFTPLRGTEGATNPVFSPDGSKLAYVTGGSPRTLRVVPLGGGPSVTITDSLVDMGGVSWGPDGYIYFDGHLEGDGLARVRETGGKPQPVTMPAQGELWHFQPEALPNGRGVLFAAPVGGAWMVGIVDLRTHRHRILFAGFTPKYVASGHLIYATVDGMMMAVPFDQDRLEVTGDAVPVAEGLALRGLGADLSISRTGTLAYTTGLGFGRSVEFFWVARDGKETPVDTTWRRPISFFTLSPDGRQVATVFDSPNRQLWVKPLNGGPAARISIERATFHRRISWSADGKEILLLAWIPGATEVMRVPADGSRLPSVFRSVPRELLGVRVSPAGDWLTFESSVGDIVGLRVRGDSVPVTIVGEASVEFVGGAVSPNGKWIAYLATDATAGGQLIVRPFPETQVAKTVVASGALGAYPAWSTDGRELFHLDGDRNLVAEEVLPGDAFTVGRQRILFNAAQYYSSPGRILPIAPAPDGRRFLVTREVTTAASRVDLIIVENFMQEVRSKVKR